MNRESATVQPSELDDPALREADAAAVQDRFVSGKPLDPAVAVRVRARAERVTEAIRNAHGLIDDSTFQSLLDDEA